MKEILFFSSTVPSNSPCVQVGSDNYQKWSLLEGKALRDQIHRQIGFPPEGTQIRIVKRAHDFGDYLDLSVFFTFGDETASELWAQRVETEFPEEWDHESKRFLRNNEYPVGEARGLLR